MTAAHQYRPCWLYTIETILEGSSHVGLRVVEHYSETTVEAPGIDTKQAHFWRRDERVLDDADLRAWIFAPNMHLSRYRELALDRFEVQRSRQHPTSEERIEKAIELAVRFDGGNEAHHLTWVIDQMVRELAGDRYEAIVTEACSDGCTWSEGTAP